VLPYPPPIEEPRQQLQPPSWLGRGRTDGSSAASGLEDRPAAATVRIENRDLRPSLSPSPSLSSTPLAALAAVAAVAANGALGDPSMYHLGQKEEVELTKIDDSPLGTPSSSSRGVSHSTSQPSLSQQGSRHTPLPPATATVQQLPQRGQAPDFKALQRHIDELTRDRFELQRGLERQAALAARLADENEALMADKNRAAATAEAARAEAAEARREAAARAGEAASAALDRDAYKMGAEEASQRAKSLAGEVVALEEKLLRAKSEHMRERAAAAAGATSAASPSTLAAGPAALSPMAFKDEAVTLRRRMAEAEEEKALLREEVRSLGERLAAVTAVQQHESAALTKRAARARDPASTGIARRAAQEASDAGILVADEEVDDEMEEEVVVGGSGLSNTDVLPPEVRALLPPSLFQPPNLPAALAMDGCSNLQDAPTLTDTLATSFPEHQVSAAVASICSLAAALEAEKRRLLAALTEGVGAMEELRTANARLQARLEAAQQRAELEAQRVMGTPARPGSAARGVEGGGARQTPAL
jgi:hypothetical protein